ncbi:MAG: hypothetical protein ACF8NJ_05550 [Phycisphaerales bacterium JB038]
MPSAPDISALEVLLADEEPTTNQRIVASLPADATAFELPAGHRPGQGETILAAVRARDAADRPAAVSRWRRLQGVGEALRLLPPPPLHPRSAVWAVRIVGNAAEVVLSLPAPPARLGYQAIELERRDGIGGVVMILSLDATHLPALFAHRPNLIAGAQRFRWSLLTSLGEHLDGPWSAAVTPTALTTTFNGVTLGAHTS